MESRAERDRGRPRPESQSARESEKFSEAKARGARLAELAQLARHVPGADERALRQRGGERRKTARPRAQRRIQKSALLDGRKRQHHAVRVRNALGGRFAPAYALGQLSLVKRPGADRVTVSEQLRGEPQCAPVAPA